MEHATEKRKRRIPLFLQAVLITLGSYLVYQYGIRPPIPASILFMFMVVTVSAVLLYVSLDNESLDEFLRPILTVIRDDRWKIVRWAFMIAIPLVAGYVVYDKTVPKIEPPITVRSVHPAPPGSITVRGKTYDLRTLENPLRKDTTNLAKHVKAGADVYIKNCYYCHGDFLDGKGPYADYINPPPANFQDVGTIAMLQESFLFWRIMKGGPGLPTEGTPWDSAMPAWEQILSEQEVWQVILFMYEFTGHKPRRWE